MFFFFNDTATTEIYTLSLHDALPIFCLPPLVDGHRDEQLRISSPDRGWIRQVALAVEKENRLEDRKSTRLNSSHSQISYAVFCLKKKKTQTRCLSSQPSQLHTCVRSP